MQIVATEDMAGLPAVQLDRLQSGLNAAARPTSEVRPRVTVAQGTALAASARTYHLPVGSSCLPLSAQHADTAPRYLTVQLQQASNVGYRQRLRSSSSVKLDVPRTEHVTIGGRAFSSTAAHMWNSLPTAVQASASLDIFRRRLKTELFERSYN